MTKDAAAGDSVEPKTVARRRRHVVEAPPSDGEDLGDDIGHLCRRLCEATMHVGIDGGVLLAVEGLEPPGRLSVRLLGRHQRCPTDDIMTRSCPALQRIFPPEGGSRRSGIIASGSPGGYQVGELFGGLLRQHRLDASLTQEALAERASLSATAIGALERGRNLTPRLSTVRQLARALELEAEELFVLTRAAAGGQPPRTGAIGGASVRCHGDRRRGGGVARHREPLTAAGSCGGAASGFSSLAARSRY
jgi:DNA-binding XRE family transcriptional regulator